MSSHSVTGLAGKSNLIERFSSHGADYRSVDVELHLHHCPYYNGYIWISNGVYIYITIINTTIITIVI